MAAVLSGAHAGFAAPASTTPINHHVSASLTAVSSLSAHRCVAVGDTTVTYGEYTIVTDGKPGKLHRFGETAEDTDAVSQPGPPSGHRGRAAQKKGSELTHL